MPLKLSVYQYNLSKLVGAFGIKSYILLKNKFSIERQKF